ncbi:MAG: DUF975 family protein, partial [Sarcina sp.]
GGFFMVSRKELKQLSKEQLRGHWKIPILVSIVLFLIQVVIRFIIPNNIVLGCLFSIFTLAIAAYISVAMCKFYLKFAENPDNSSFKHLKVPFNVTLKAFVVNLIFGIPLFIISIFISIGVMVAVGTAVIADSFFIMIFIPLITILLFLVGTIIISLYFAQVFFILADDESYGCIESIKRSIKLMKGHKWEYFILQLSFIGWSILATLTLGIGLIWLIPYMQLTLTNYYNELVNVKNDMYFK